jgi:hypothetical protein
MIKHVTDAKAADICIMTFAHSALWVESAEPTTIQTYQVHTFAA